MDRQGDGYKVEGGWNKKQDRQMRDGGASTRVLSVAPSAHPGQGGGRWRGEGWGGEAPSPLGLMEKIKKQKSGG